MLIPSHIHNDWFTEEMAADVLHTYWQSKHIQVIARSQGQACMAQKTLLCWQFEASIKGRGRTVPAQKWTFWVTPLRSVVGKTGDTVRNVLKKAEAIEITDGQAELEWLIHVLTLQGKRKDFPSLTVDRVVHGQKPHVVIKQHDKEVFRIYVRPVIRYEYA